MKSCKVEIKGSEIVIHAIKGPLFIRAVLSILFAIALLIPFAILALVIKEGDGLHIGQFIGTGISWFIAFRLLRTILWNNKGKELIKLNSNSISYEADFGWFKDGKTTIENNGNITIEEIDQEDGNSTVKISNDNSSNEINTVLKISKKDIEKIKALSTSKTIE